MLMAKKRNVGFSTNFKSKLNQRRGQVEVKFGFVDATTIELTDEMIEAIIAGIEQMDSFEKYYEIPENKETGIPKNYVAVIIHTLEEGAENSDGITAKNGRIQWSVKCEAAPNNSLKLWMTEDQYAASDYDKSYLYIGIRTIQWMQYVLDKNGDVIMDKKGNKEVKKKRYLYEEPVGTSYEGHTLNLTEFVEV